MSHWIVQVSVNGTGQQFAHVESDTPPQHGDHLGQGRTHVLVIDVGPHESAEDAWIDWHDKRQNILELL
jgi:hypothetical protein